MVRLIVPYTHLFQETRAAARQSELTPEFRRLRADTSYHRLLRDLWAAGESFVILEQDILPHPGAIEELADCEQAWCAFAYPYLGPDRLHAGLGLTKFADSLLRAEPHVLDVIAEWSDEAHPPTHWCRLDAWISTLLNQRGYRVHQHEPLVEHLGSLRPSHGCAD